MGNEYGETRWPEPGHAVEVESDSQMDIWTNRQTRASARRSHLASRAHPRGDGGSAGESGHQVVRLGCGSVGPTEYVLCRSFSCLQVSFRGAALSALERDGLARDKGRPEARNVKTAKGTKREREKRKKKSVPAGTIAQERRLVCVGCAEQR